MLYESFTALKNGLNSTISDRNLWYINNINDQSLDYIGSLPHSSELYLSGKLIRLFHAHPLNFNRYYAHSPIEQRRELFGYKDNVHIKKNSNVAIYADIHSAYTNHDFKNVLSAVSASALLVKTTLCFIAKRYPLIQRFQSVMSITSKH